MAEQIVDFWRQFKPKSAPYFHPDDEAVLFRQRGKHVDGEPRNFNSFLTSPRFGDFQDHRLHLSLLPIPYGGKLATAEIVVLLLNPGFSYTDYYAETHSRLYRRHLELNLHQTLDGVEFPFLWLDPQFCWHSGFDWWERKLRDVVTIIAKKRFEGRYLDALRDVSNRLAHIEIVPYHSPAFRAHSLIDDLPSAKVARQFVQTELLKRARRGESVIIVTRQEATWGLPPVARNLVVYRGGQTRGASLGPTTPGGRAILKRYGIRRP